MDIFLNLFLKLFSNNFNLITSKVTEKMSYTFLQKFLNDVLQEPSLVLQSDMLNDKFFLSFIFVYTFNFMNEYLCTFDVSSWTGAIYAYALQKAISLDNYNQNYNILKVSYLGSSLFFTYKDIINTNHPTFNNYFIDKVHEIFPSYDILNYYYY